MSWIQRLRSYLLQSLADKHARKHKRVRLGMVGGSVAATALVVTLLATLVTGNSTQTVDPATLTEAEIIRKAKDADAAAQGMIMHFTTEGGGWPKSESWALRSAHRGRLVQPGVRDYAVWPDKTEDIDYARRIYTIAKTPIDVVMGHVAASPRVRALFLTA